MKNNNYLFTTAVVFMDEFKLLLNRTSDQLEFYNTISKFGEIKVGQSVEIRKIKYVVEDIYLEWYNIPVHGNPDLVTNIKVKSIAE